MAKGDICRIEGCTKIITQNRTVCGTHRARMRNHGSYDKPIIVKIKKLPDGIVKICKKHGPLKAEDVTPTHNKKKIPGYEYPYCHAHCKKCRNEKQRKWASRNPINVRNQNRYTRFKLRPHEFENLVAEQGNKCAICFQPETAINSYIKGIDSLSVDHNHSTGKIRELLCKKCNTLIGMSRESIEILASSIDYLRRHNK